MTSFSFSSQVSLDPFEYVHFAGWTYFIDSSRVVAFWNMIKRLVLFGKMKGHRFWIEMFNIRVFFFFNQQIPYFLLLILSGQELINQFQNYSHFLKLAQTFQGSEDCVIQEWVSTLAASILTWGSISGQRRSWPSPTPGAEARHQESHKKTDGDVEGWGSSGACQTGSHQRRLPAAGRPGTSVHGHGGAWARRRSQHQCWPVLGREAMLNNKNKIIKLFWRNAFLFIILLWRGSELCKIGSLFKYFSLKVIF